MPNGARSARGHHDSSKSPVRHCSQPRAQRFAAAAGAERSGGEEPRMPHPASKPRARGLSTESSQSMCAASQSKHSASARPGVGGTARDAPCSPRTQVARGCRRAASAPCRSKQPQPPRPSARRRRSFRAAEASAPRCSMLPQPPRLAGRCHRSFHAMPLDTEAAAAPCSLPSSPPPHCCSAALVRHAPSRSRPSL